MLQLLALLGVFFRSGHFVEGQNVHHTNFLSPFPSLPRTCGAPIFREGSCDPIPVEECFLERVS